MNRSVAIFGPSVARPGKRRIPIGVALLTLLAGWTGLAVVQHWRASEARRREARAIMALRARGGQIVDRLIELVPLGGALPGSGVAPLRLALKLRDPGVTDNDLAVLAEFGVDRLCELDLLNCMAGDVTLARAGKFRRLTLLGVGQARNSKDEPWPTGPTGLLLETGFAHLERLPDLEIVGLHGPDATDRALAHLGGARDLRTLILYGSRVTGAGLAALGPKPRLSTLKLGGTRLRDDDLAALARFPSLEVLDVRDTAVTDVGLSRLQAVPRLKTPVLDGCAVSAAAVDALMRARPGLAVSHAPSVPQR